MIPKTTLEQWAVLNAVIQHGSFALAAEHLNKSQSAVSYTIKTLQSQLPVKVLEIKGRKAQLTKAGEILLRRSGQLIEQANSLEKIAKSLAQNWESEVTMAVDVVFPIEIVYQAIAKFEPISDGCRIQIIETTLSATDEAVINRHADLVLATNVPTGYLGSNLLSVQFVAVSSPDHPLQQLSRQLNEQDLKQYRQIVVKDGGLKRTQNVGWLNSEQRWTVSNFNNSVALLERGMGFAWLPTNYINASIELGKLAPLDLMTGQTRELTCKLVLPDVDSAGPATKALAEIIKDLCKEHAKP